MISSTRLQRIAEAVMVLGIVALCQPWNLLLHRYGLTVTIIGLLTFMFTGWFGKPDAKKDDGDGVFDVSDHHDGRPHESRHGGRS